MQVELIKPKSRFLRQFIQYFFFIRNDDEKYNKTHICYPNTNYCLGLHKGTKTVQSSETEYEVLHSNNYQSYLTGIYQKPINVHYQGKFSEVCIDFEPLGLEVLTGKKVSNNTFIQDVVELAFPKFQNEIYDLAFSSKNPYFCAEKLEQFFLKNMPNKTKFEFLPFNQINAFQVDELKEIHYKSYRSIHRFYRNSLSLSPKEFLNLRRFRRSLSQLHSANKLTDVAYTQGFSDQAHLTREFKKYTGLTPKKFQSQSSLVNKTLCWTRK